MNQNPGSDLRKETSHLLSELERALDHCSTIRAIARHREQLYSLESITGPSPKTRNLRAEIRQLEQHLSAARALAEALPARPMLPI